MVGVVFIIPQQESISDFSSPRSMSSSSRLMVSMGNDGTLMGCGEWRGKSAVLSGVGCLRLLGEQLVKTGFVGGAE